MKPVEIVLRMGSGMKKNDGGSKSKIYSKPICKYHNVPPIQLLYANKCPESGILAVAFNIH
jgi:hypothetical protein